MLPPVGTRGRPLRDLVLSPALGESQSRAVEVEEKGRRLEREEVTGVVFRETSAWSAERRPASG